MTAQTKMNLKHEIYMKYKRGILFWDSFAGKYDNFIAAYTGRTYEN